MNSCVFGHLSGYLAWHGLEVVPSSIMIMTMTMKCVFGWAWRGGGGVVVFEVALVLYGLFIGM